MALFTNIWDSVFGSSDNTAKYAEEANKRLEAAKSNMKTTQQMYQEGRGAAGQAAADKAGIAKKQAKASAMMNNSSRLAAATQGAAAAADASAQGYDATANQAAALEQGNQQQRLALEKAEADNILAQGKAKDEATQRQRDRYASIVGGIFSGLASSDKNVKNFKKHTYVPSKERK